MVGVEDYILILDYIYLSIPCKSENIINMRGINLLIKREPLPFSPHLLEASWKKNVNYYITQGVFGVLLDQ